MARNRTATMRRQTQPAGWNPYLAGTGLGLLARRGAADANFLTTKAALRRLGQGNPLRLLSFLPDLHPTVGLATWNALRLTCAPGDMRIRAVKPGPGSEGDDAGSAALDALWASLPKEIGGLMGLQTSLTLQLMFTGLTCIEGVPGARGLGIGQVWPVDSLTIKMDRDAETMEAMPWQRQIYPNAKDGEAPVPSGDYVGGYRRLSTDTFFWRTIDAWPDDMYGRAPYAAVLNEILCDFAMMQDLRDAVHNAAWPRLGYGFSFKEMFDVAVNVVGIKDPNLAAGWVQERFDELVVKIGGMKPDDNTFYDAAGDLKTIEGSKGFSALKEILVYLRQRIVQGLKSLPTLMGINDGSTQTYTTVEWAIYAAGLQTIQALVAELITDVASLHLRLLGLPLVAVAEYTPIRTNDAMVEAQTEAIQLANLLQQVRLGFISLEDACQEMTGHSPVGAPLPGVLEVAGNPAITQLPPEEQEAAQTRLTQLMETTPGLRDTLKAFGFEMEGLPVRRFGSRAKSRSKTRAA